MPNKPQIDQETRGRPQSRRSSRVRAPTPYYPRRSTDQPLDGKKGVRWRDPLEEAGTENAPPSSQSAIKSILKKTSAYGPVKDHVEEPCAVISQKHKVPQGKSVRTRPVRKFPVRRSWKRGLSAQTPKVAVSYQYDLHEIRHQPC